MDDGINKALMMLPRLYISEQKCELALSAIRNYRKKWDEQKLDWMNEPFKDWSSHFSGVLRYTGIIEDQMTNAEPKV